MKLLKILLGLSIALASVANATEKVSLVIKNGTVLTINPQNEVIPQGVVVIDKDQIIAVGDEKLLKKYQGEKIIDAHNGIVMPGMINTHQHLPMIAFRGLGEEGIKNRLFAYFFPLEGEKLSRDLIYKATVHGAIDMAMSGVTTYADMYYHMDEMAKATKAVGLRAVLGETIIKFPVVDAKTPYGGLDYALNFIKDYKNDELITPAFAPHAPYTVSKEKLVEIFRLSEQMNIPVLMHMAEFDDEASRLKLNGQSEVEYLETLGIFSPRLLIAHGIYLTEKDLDILKKYQVGIAYNPMANAKGATGIANAYAMLQKGMKVGLGTDGPMSSNQVDLFRTLSYASTMQRLKHNDRTIMTPDQIVRLATMGGAEALNMADKIGSLEAGKKADVIILETQSSNMVPNYDPFATIVFQANPSNVSTTIVNGKIVMENRQIKTYDMQKNRQQMAEMTKDIGEFAKELAKKAKEMN